MRAGLQVEYLSHIEGVTPPIWKSMPCKREENLLAGRRNLLLRRINFVTLDGASLLLGLALNIVEVSQKLVPFLTIQAPPFK